MEWYACRAVILKPVELWSAIFVKRYNLAVNDCIVGH
jgi:hypothetical protein